jgi:hypothetical protein
MYAVVIAVLSCMYFLAEALPLGKLDALSWRSMNVSHLLEESLPSPKHLVSANHLCAGAALY